MKPALSRAFVQAPPLAPDTTAYRARVAQSAEALDRVRSRLVDRWAMRPLRGQGLSMGRLNLAIGVTLAQSLVPQVNAAGAAVDAGVAMVAADYSEAAGWQTDGSTKYLNTGLTPADPTGTLAVYLRTAQTSNTTGRFMAGAQNAAATQNFSLRGNRSSVNGASAGSVSAAWGGASAASNAVRVGGVVPGLWQVARRGATDAELFLNGVSVATSATSIAPGTTAQALAVMCLNSGGTPALFLEASSAVAAYAVTDAMTALQASSFYAVIQNLQTVLGRGV